MWMVVNEALKELPLEAFAIFGAGALERPEALWAARVARGVVRVW